MVLLVVLTALVLAASLALTLGVRSRAEAIIASSLVFNALVTGPIYVLGLAGRLSAVTLGAFEVLLHGALLALSVRAKGPRVLRAIALRFGDLALAPLRGIGAAIQRRSLVTVGAIAATLAFPYMLLSAYLAPAWRDWDALWYHEPIVAFTIQNHGFSPVDLPTGLQVVNGVQRLCEMTQLWFAIFAGRKLVDVANVVFMPLLAASMFALARRFTRDVVTSTAWAAALVLVPGFLRLLQSTMVDPQSAALLLAAAYWVTHRDFDRRAVVYAILALTLAVGAKIWSIVPVGLLSLVLLLRIIANRKALGARTAAMLAAGGAFTVIGMQALTYLRNLILFANPFWPMVQYDNPKLGIHWKGAIAVSASTGLSFNEPFMIFYEKMLGRPYTATGPHHTWQIDDYGFAWSWIVLPLGAFCAAMAVLRWIVSAVGARGRLFSPSQADTDSAAAATLAIVAAASLYLSPAIHIARYHVASLGMLAACICWLSGRNRRSLLADGAALFASIGSIMMLHWAPRKAPWTCVYEPAQIVRWLKTPFPKREVADIGSPPMLISPVIEATGMAREREVHAGDVVGFDNIDFVALLWNSDYSNRVVWLSSGDPLGEAEKKGARWVYTRPGTTLSSQLAAASSTWELVGPLEAERFGNVWRRKR
jgi:hypothetical protein